MNIELTEEQKIKAYKDKALYKVMREILLRESEIDITKEHFWVCGLALNNKLMYVELVSLGNMYSTVVDPMDVFSWALQKRVAKIIMVHNHPSGELAPTKKDLDITDRMIQVGKLVHTFVVDHLIITTEDYYGFERGGDMKELEKSTKYVPGYILVDRIKKQATKKREVEMAKALKEKGIDVSVIADTSGLSKEEIEKL